VLPVSGRETWVDVVRERVLESPELAGRLF
jgi:hypothetical protein